MRATLWSVAVVVVCAAATVQPATVGAEPSPPDNTLEVCIRPLGKVDTDLLAVAVKGVVQVYGFDTRVLDGEPMPKDAWYAPRKRYRADVILDHLHESVPPDTGCDVVVGFTRHDISTTKGEHKDWGIFGLGELGGRTAAVSTYRLGRRSNHADDKAKRTVKVVNHEIGHVLGVPHGGEPGCLMNDAEGTIDAVDAESGVLCAPSITWIEARLGVTLPRLEAMDWSALLAE